ncbi:MAG: hypothetical protein HEEMFOPI_00288 [Holosporales bacterium]
MTTVLMPKATAVWLIENTGLTFTQIADFCNLHIIEVQAIADGEVGSLIGFDPIANGQLDASEIERCEKDETAKIALKTALTADMILGKKKKRYVAISKRQDRPDAIAWLVRYYPHIPDSSICELLGTTKKTVQSIRTKTHRNSAIIKPKSPVQLGMCSQSDIDALLRIYPVTSDEGEDLARID